MDNGFRITVDARAWQQAQDGLRRLGRMNWTALHDEVGEYLEAEVAARFRSSQDPEGRPWPPLKKPRRQRAGRRTRRQPKRIKLLVQTGRLRGSVTHRATGTEVAVGTNLVYAARHNFGFEQNGVVWTPQRQFIGFSKADSGAIGQISEDHVARAVRL